MWLLDVNIPSKLAFLLKEFGIEAKTIAWMECSEQRQFG